MVGTWLGKVLGKFLEIAVPSFGWEANIESTICHWVGLLIPKLPKFDRLNPADYGWPALPFVVIGTS